MVPIQPRISPTSLKGPDISIHRTGEESRYFDVFIEFSARELPGYLSTDFWSRIVSQESHAVTPIRYAAIAIGALNKSLGKVPESNLKVNIIQNIDKKHHEYAVLYFLKAVQSLNQYLSTARSPQTRVALISCLLFVCFETFQGSFVSTCRQYFGGLTILRSYCSRNSWAASRSRQRALPQQGSLENISMPTTLSLPTRQDTGIVSKPRELPIPAINHPQTGSKRSLDWTDVVMPKDRSPVAGEIEPFVWQPYTNRTARGETKLTKEHSQMVDTPIYDYPNHSPAAESQSFQAVVPDRGKSLSSPSDSTASTPRLSATGSCCSSSGSTPPQMLSRKQPLESRSPTPPILHHDLAIEHSLIQMFTRLDGSGEFFGMPPLIPPMIWDIHKIHHRPVPDAFPDFMSAQRSWDFLMDEALQLYRRTFFNKVFAPENRESPAKIAKQYAYYMQQFSAFERAFQPILDNSVDSDGTVSNPAALVLSLYQRCTPVILATVQEPSEMIYDSYLPEFEYVTSTCARLLASSYGAKRCTRFSFEAGFIPPLHFTATKCRDPIIRRKAIDILSSTSRQEGMWDSLLCGRIATWLMNCEEEGLSPPPLESPQSNLYITGRETAEKELFDHSDPQPAWTMAEPLGGWEDGKMLPDVINGIIGEHFIDDAPEEDPTPLTPTPDAIESLKKRRPVYLKDWRVPEKNRVQITVVQFHIPERFLRFKCRRTLPREDGTREEKEAVLTW